MISRHFTAMSRAEHLAVLDNDCTHHRMWPSVRLRNALSCFFYRLAGKLVVVTTETRLGHRWSSGQSVVAEFESVLYIWKQRVQFCSRFIRGVDTVKLDLNRI